MEEKYYEIIVKLIKNHKKYSGLEAILEDIVTDVQERAKVVMNNVTNSDVVETYLAKIVSSSIITVPKKLNFNTNVNHKVITNSIATLDTTTNSKTSALEFDTADIEDISTIENFDADTGTTKALDTMHQDNVDISLVDKMINGVSNIDNEVILSKNITLENDTSVDLNNIDNLEIIEELDNTKNSELLIAEETNFSENTDLTNSDNGLVEKDETLEEKEENSDIENFEQVIETEELEIEDSVLEIEEDSDTESFEQVIETEELEIENSVLEIEEDSDTENFEQVIETEELEIENSVLEIEEDSDTENFEQVIETEELEIEDSVLEIEEDSDTESFEQVIETEELEIEDSVLEIEEDSDTESFEQVIETEELENSIEIIETIDEQENIEIQENVSSFDSKNTEPTFDIKAPNYKIFNYEPEALIIEDEYVVNAIKDLAKKKPELKILDIIDLKYKKSYSIEEIAKSLSIDTDSVLETLNDIIDTVKD